MSRRVPIIEATVGELLAGLWCLAVAIIGALVVIGFWAAVVEAGLVLGGG